MQNKDQANADGENRYGGRGQCRRGGELAHHLDVRSAGEDLVARSHHAALKVGAHQEPLPQQQPDQVAVLVASAALLREDGEGECIVEWRAAEQQRESEFGLAAAEHTR